MSWNARISAIVLVILTGLPVSGTICALLCQPPARSAARASGHHGDMACAESVHATDAPQMRGLSSHDCRSHALTAQPPAAFASERASVTLSSFRPAIVEGSRTGSAILLRLPLWSDAPPGTPLLVPSIVLRV